MISRIYLALIAFMFTAFGLWSLIDPIGMTASLNVDIGGPAGVFEMSGVYGGISLAGAILCALGAARASLTRPALIFVATYMGGYVIGRTYHFIAVGMPPAENIQFAIGEYIMFAIAAALLYFTRSR